MTPATTDRVSGAWGIEPVQFEDTSQALAVFDSGARVRVPELLGRWRGSGVHTGHPLDGLLEASGWYGKEFRSEHDVFPLLFRHPSGTLHAVEPAWLPLRWIVRMGPLQRSRAAAIFALCSPLLRTQHPSARLRSIEWHGVATAAMVYDRQPVIDVFRAVGPDRLIGLMDCRYIERPFFFALRRE